MVAEEVLLLYKSFDEMQLKLSYSEKTGTVNLHFENGGVPFNPLENPDLEDEIGLKLIKARCQSINYDFLNGRNNLTLAIKNQ
jgi:hypothetical protein